MARFDVYRNPASAGFLLDCQADLLDHLRTRFVVPLIATDTAPRPLPRLNPVFEVDGSPHLLATHFAATVPAHELKMKMGSLAQHDVAILAALDMLIVGY